MNTVIAYSFANASEALLGLLHSIYDYGETVSVRGMETKELTGITVQLRHPTKRCIFVKGRNDNIFAKCAETLWMLAGRNDVEWLSYYLPKAKEFSDNGRTWRGAYGPRIRAWNGDNKTVDQLQYVFNKLKEDPTTRQAVISIWRPDIDTEPGKDIPCNNWIDFIIRDGALHMSCAQRSSDIIWGYSGIDTFAWSVLHQILADALDVKVGAFTHYITSLHLYSRHYAKADEILTIPVDDETPYDMYPETNLQYLPVPTVDIESMDMDLARVFSMEDAARKNGMSVAIWNSLRDNIGANNLLRVMGSAMLIWIAMKEPSNFDGDFIADLVNDLPDCDLRLAIIENILRSIPGYIDRLNIVNNLYDWLLDFHSGD